MNRNHILPLAIIATAILSGSLQPHPAALILATGSAQYSPGAHGSSAYEASAPPLLGPQPTLVILIEFADVTHTLDKGAIDALVFKEMADYYSAVSYGRIQVVGDTIGWFRTPEDMAHYGQDRNAIVEGSDSRAVELLSDAILAAQDYGVSFKDYSRILVVHAGAGQEDEPSHTDLIWSQAYPRGLSFHMNDGTTIRSAAIVPELESAGHSPLGVYTHEFGHLLGLPDLYDVNADTTSNDLFMGRWSVMGTGLWLGDPRGSSPAELEAWSRIKLGWLAPDIINNEPGNVSFQITELRPIESSAGNRAIEVPTQQDYYYLFELRQKIGFDKYLPGQGVLITRIEESRGSGGGIVRIVDANTNTGTLNDAAFQAGETFKDTANNFFLRIIKAGGKLGLLFGNKDPATQPIQMTNLEVADSVNGTYSLPTAISGRLTDEPGSPLQGMEVRLQYFVSDHWTDLSTALTDQSGRVEFNQVFAFIPGQYQIRLFFPGQNANGRYLVANDQLLTLFLRKIATTIEVETPSSIVAAQGTAFTMRATDEFRNLLRNVQITVSVDGKVIRAEKISGETTLTINFPLYQVGKHALKVEVEGNDIYSGASNLQEINVVAPTWSYLLALGLPATVVAAVLLLRHFHRRTQSIIQG